MIVNDLDIVGVAFEPAKANSILLIDPDAVESFAISLECFGTIRWRNIQQPEILNGVDLLELPPRHTPDLLGTSSGPLGASFVTQQVAFPAIAIPTVLW